MPTLPMKATPLPVGLMLVGGKWQEAAIYRAAAAFEAAGDWRAM